MAIKDPNRSVAVALANHADSIGRLAVATAVELRAEESAARVFALLKAEADSDTIRALAVFCKVLGRDLDSLASEIWRNS